MGLSKGGTNALENSMLWPQYVKQRISDTYLYFGGSILISAASAAAVFRTPSLLRLVSGSGMLSLIGTMAAMIASGMVVRSIPYQPGFGTKQLAWMTHSAILGAVIAPLCFIGGPIMVRAAWYTAGIVGGLSTVAVCAPSEKFMNMGKIILIYQNFKITAFLFRWTSRNWPWCCLRFIGWFNVPFTSNSIRSRTLLDQLVWRSFTFLWLPPL